MEQFWHDVAVANAEWPRPRPDGTTHRSMASPNHSSGKRILTELQDGDMNCHRRQNRQAVRSRQTALDAPSHHTMTLLAWIFHMQSLVCWGALGGFCTRVLQAAAAAPPAWPRAASTRCRHHTLPPRIMTLMAVDWTRPSSCQKKPPHRRRRVLSIPQSRAAAPSRQRPTLRPFHKPADGQVAQDWSPFAWQKGRFERGRCRLSSQRPASSSSSSSPLGPVPVLVFCGFPKSILAKGYRPRPKVVVALLPPSRAVQKRAKAKRAHAIPRRRPSWVLSVSPSLLVPILPF